MKELQKNITSFREQQKQQALLNKSKSTQHFNVYGISNQMNDFYTGKDMIPPAITQPRKNNQPLKMENVTAQSNVLNQDEPKFWIKY